MGPGAITRFVRGVRRFLAPVMVPRSHRTRGGCRMLLGSGRARQDSVYAEPLSRGPVSANSRLPSQDVCPPTAIVIPPRPICIRWNASRTTRNTQRRGRRPTAAPLGLLPAGFAGEGQHSAFRRETAGQSGDLALDLDVCVAVDREVVQAGCPWRTGQITLSSRRHAWQADHTVQLSATIGVLLDGRVTTTAA